MANEKSSEKSVRVLSYDSKTEPMKVTGAFLHRLVLDRGNDPWGDGPIVRLDDGTPATKEEALEFLQKNATVAFPIG